MLPSSTATKIPRPMHSKSKPFEAGYAAFVDDVFKKDIRGVAQVETSTTRALVLAGIRRIVLDKRSGLLHCEELVNPTEAGAEIWHRTETMFLASFWAKNSEILLELRSAWCQRLEAFLPPADVCFPKLTKLQVSKRITAEGLYRNLIARGAQRRCATPALRGAVVRCVTWALWNFLADREVLRLCHAYFGRFASLEAYNYAVRHRAELAARARETPNLTPLIGTYLQSQGRGYADTAGVPSNVVALAKTHLFDPRAAGKSGGVLAREPWIAPEPLTPLGWRYLATNTRTAIDRIWWLADQPFFYGDSTPGSRVARGLNFLAKTGERPPLGFQEWWLTACGRLERETPENFDIARSTLGLGRFLRLAAAQACQARKRGKLNRFIANDLALAWDWFRGDETRSHLGTLRSLEKNATWPSVMRAQHEWHASAEAREVARRAADRREHARHLAEQRARTWKSAVDPCIVQGVEVKPLTSGKALQAEGRQMKHCVRGFGYIAACSRGTTRIFSLRSEDERATAELLNDGGHTWKVGQVMLRENERASRKMRSVASELAKLYSGATRAATAKEKAESVDSA